MNVRTGLLAALVFGVIVGAFLLGNCAPQAFSRAEAKAEEGFPRYNVVDTEGHNLIVTDNRTNTLYFYTIEKEKEIGSELHLRGSVDLTEVGKPTIKPKHARAEK
ncbi:MAG TPA: hypothetical protein VH643_29800 [Gemmataceae bacterium]